MSEIYVYPRDTEGYIRHSLCTIYLTGVHKGNRYCATHGVPVAEPDAEETRGGAFWHPAPAR